jgi:hypothetical protein
VKPFSQVREPVKRLMNDLLSDTAIAESLTYKQYQGQAFSESDGYNLDTFTDYDVTGIRSRKVRRSASVFQGSVEKGDHFFIFRLTDLPDSLSMKDKIVDAGDNVYSIVAPVEKILDLFVTVAVDAP